MFCPNCGQQSITEGLRFCRHCGFRLDGVAQLLTSGGNPPVYAQFPQLQAIVPTGDSPRRKGYKFGVKLMLTSAVLFPFFLLFAVEAVDSPFPLFAPFTVFLAGLARVVYARLLEDAAPPTYAPIAQPIPAQLRAPLAAAQPVAAPQTPDHYQAPQQPSSIAEPTTNLLNRR
jgi:hypothetical protein